MNIKVNELTYSYINNPIFDSINLEFSKNKFHGILGPNGCGKTTLLKTILKLLKIDHNSIYIDNEDILDIERDSFAKKISYVEQNSSQLPHISVRDYINLSRYLYDDYNEKNNRTIDNIISLLKIKKLELKYIDELSGGELQKVIIARALSQETKILILDEPTANLDPLHQVEIMSLLSTLVKEKQITIITTLHDINLALSFCDNVVLINKNQIIQGPTNKIINQNNIKKYFNLNSHFIKNPFTKKDYVILNQ